jgi:DNA-binding GntR family transcriptional regulator
VVTCEHFAVNILDEDQADLALHFASKATDKFASVHATPGDAGDPLIENALATLECRVADAFTGGTHWVILGRVERASARVGAPLTYFRGEFGRMQLAQDESAVVTLRRRIMKRDVGVGTPLSIDELAAEMDMPRGAVYHALARLTGEWLVVRNAEGRFVVRPVTREAVDSALTARRAILRGVVALLINNLSSGDLERLEDRLRSLRAAGPEWRQALGELQRQLLLLAGGETLVEAFKRADVAAMIASRFGPPKGREEVYQRQQVTYTDLVRALGEGNLEAANDAVDRILAVSRASIDAIFAGEHPSR